MPPAGYASWTVIPSRRPALTYCQVFFHRGLQRRSRRMSLRRQSPQTESNRRKRRKESADARLLLDARVVLDMPVCNGPSRAKLKDPHSFGNLNFHIPKTLGGSCVTPILSAIWQVSR
jgi:hypothetical protein